MSSQTLSTPLRFFVTVSCVLALNAHAEWWKPTTWFSTGKPRRIEFLVVTGNYVKSRVLAELIQRETKQPILLLPSGKEKESLYYIMPNGESGAVELKHFVEFVNFLQPKQVLYLGNELYAPDEYLKQLENAHTVSVAIREDDWDQIAYSVGDLLKLKRLYYDYLVLMNQMDEFGNVIPPTREKVFGGFLTKDDQWPPVAEDGVNEEK